LTKKLREIEKITCIINVCSGFYLSVELRGFEASFTVMTEK